MDHRPDWYRSNRYKLHFDRPCSLAEAERIVLHPSRITQHAFLPLITHQVGHKRKVQLINGTLERNSRSRTVSYPGHLDGHIYNYYRQILSECYEQQVAQYQLADHILAFRPGQQSNIEVAIKAFRAIEQMGDCTAIGVDVHAFFDSLDHSILKQAWQKLLGTAKLPDDHYTIFRSLTRFSYVDRDAIYAQLGLSRHNPKPAGEIWRLCSAKTFRKEIRGRGLLKVNRQSKGIPQGVSITALLSNIYMLEFDKHLKTYAEAAGGHYFRFCDDILLLRPPNQEQQALATVEALIEQLKLELNPTKTEVVSFQTIQGRISADRSLQYLGLIFNGREVRIRDSSLDRFRRKMRNRVRLARKTQAKYNCLRAKRGQPPTRLYTRKLYQQNTHLGRQNFIRYAMRVAKQSGSTAINNQIKQLLQQFEALIRE